MSKATLALHKAIRGWDVAGVKAEVRGGADVCALRPVTRDEQFASWERGRAPRVDEIYGVTAVGMLFSEAYLCLQAAEGAIEGAGGGASASAGGGGAGGRPLPFTGEVVAEVLRTLLEGGAGVNDVIERFGVGGMTHGSVTALEAARRVIASGAVPRARAGRAGVLVGALRVLLASGKLAGFGYDDLVTWGGTHRADAVAAIMEYGAVTVSVAGKGGALAPAVVPPLAAAVIRGNLPLARQLLEAGAPVDGGDADGLTPLMHCTGSADPANVDDDADARRPTMALVELLLHGGADVTARDGRRRHALHHFAGAKTALLDAAARRFVCLRLLREGLSTADRDSAGWSVLAHCMERRDTLLAHAMTMEERWLRRAAGVMLWAARAPSRPAGPPAAAAATTPVVVGRAIRRRSDLPRTSPASAATT